ncbi:UDP-2,3-diacylglucosamine diphosphatase LpxI [Rhodobacterales bacterium HKCCE3408]|nr:UDP-2,3-diacylglucosamine diphosphatase LpxI [Rhodobacterales bacterium HKCCE3408]
MTRAILAGTGALPWLLLEAGPAEVITFAGVKADLPHGVSSEEYRFEQFGRMIRKLQDRGVTEICLAGGMSRPALDPSRMDPATLALMPRLVPVLQKGDDTLLRELMAILEEAGFRIRAAHELRPDLIATADLFDWEPTKAQRADAARAREVLTALGSVDVGQGAVAARGQILGIETMQGTDEMLDFVGRTAPGSGGVFVKRSKRDQDRRVDMPAIGPATVTLAARAGLSGIELGAGSVLVLGPEAVEAAAEADNVAIWTAP